VNIHTTAAVGDDIYVVTKLKRIQHGEFHAIVRCQPQHNQFGDFVMA
jgi:hypothetical protein